jgi:hypothetical protein
MGRRARLLRGDGAESSDPAAAVRTTDDKEVRLGSYEMFHRGKPLTEKVWEKLMLGLSTRNYGQAIRQGGYLLHSGWPF